DHYRSNARKQTSYVEDMETSYYPFTKQGYWKEGERPGDWAVTEEKSIENAEFMQVLNNCMKRLPASMASVFMMRVVEEAPTEEVCNEMQISSSNLWVLLHRARLQLRKCIETNWFGRMEDKQ
ncbi:MAG: RNA polymerase subunit sigma-70, partial [Bacteroidales bacterium]|nr:RNA polymerase subunit sigma-70 [Bacteroidales bacterium]